MVTWEKLATALHIVGNRYPGAVVDTNSVGNLVIIDGVEFVGWIDFGEGGHLNWCEEPIPLPDRTLPPMNYQDVVEAFQKPRDED